MVDSSQQMLAHAKKLLSVLDRKIVFVGGATVHLYVDDLAAAPVRTTKDVDVVVAAETYADFAKIEAALRQHGFEQTLEDDGPICRWTKDGLILDIMPTKPEIIGFAASPWFEEGFGSAVEHLLENGDTIAVFDVLHLVAAKIEAFEDRGDGDLFASQDFEDLATILDASKSIWDRLEGRSKIAIFIKDWLRDLEPDELEDALAGHVGSHQRADVLVRRIRDLRSA